MIFLTLTLLSTLSIFTLSIKNLVEEHLEKHINQSIIEFD
jgi:hypothetical protein